MPSLQMLTSVSPVLPVFLLPVINATHEHLYKFKSTDQEFLRMGSKNIYQTPQGKKIENRNAKGI